MVVVGNYRVAGVLFTCDSCGHEVQTTDDFARQYGIPIHCGKYMAVPK